MYFPYLRAKRFELIALNESIALIKKNLKRISPIIEPVAKDTASLKRTVDIFKKHDVNFSLIINPTVGGHSTQPKEIIDFINTELSDFENFQVAIILTDQASLSNAKKNLGTIKTKSQRVLLIHSGEVEAPENLEQVFKGKEISYHVIDYLTVSRRYDRAFRDKSKCVSLEDHMTGVQKNSDYSKNIDEFFSKEHLEFSLDNFAGFSDYLTIGAGYSETGFLPYAVVIHITYPDAKGEIRIRHFVSDSNDDTSDVAGKFSEALNKLIAWKNQASFSTASILEFEKYHKTQHYPGLGVLKKLSIMNHLEVVLEKVSF